MEENEGRYRELVRKFYQVYRPLQEKYGLRHHMHFDIYGNNLIEIWECGVGKKGRCICRVKEETETVCYERAIKMMEYYGRKEMASNGKKAG